MWQKTWAFPWTLLGIVLGIIGLATGGGVQRIDGVLEFHGGVLNAILRWAPISGGAAAVTLGHTVLGRTVNCLERTRGHERVHVRQYEKWGPFFVPAYFAFSLWLYLQGCDPYLDNPFEQEAYDHE